MTPHFKAAPLNFIAAEYGCGAYGQGSYENATCSTQQPIPEQPSGWLADTGYDVIIPIALGLSLLIAGIILLLKRLRRSAQK